MASINSQSDIKPNAGTQNLTRTYVTLTKNDPRFMQYLLGNVGVDKVTDKTVIPVPVQTLNLQKGNESVTFQLMPSALIEKPWNWFLRLLRWELLLVTLAPAIMVAAANNGFVTSWYEFVWAMTSLVFLHLSVYCANDYLDHMGGLDRVSDKGGSHVIQMGWITARGVRYIGAFAFTLAFLTSLPLFIQRPELALLAFGVLGVLGLGYRFSRWGTPSPLLGFIVLLGIFGPMLTLSIEWLLVRRLSLNAMYLGLFTGLMALTYVHAKQIFSMATDQEAKIPSVAILLGVDRALLLLRILCVGMYAAFLVTLFNYWGFGQALWGLAAAPLLFELFLTLRRVNSPFSSSLQSVFRRTLVFYATAVMIFVLGSLL